MTTPGFKAPELVPGSDSDSSPEALKAFLEKSRGGGYGSGSIGMPTGIRTVDLLADEQPQTPLEGSFEAGHASAQANVVQGRRVGQVEFRNLKKLEFPAVPEAEPRAYDRERAACGYGVVKR